MQQPHPITCVLLFSFLQWFICVGTEHFYRRRWACQISVFSFRQRVLINWRDYYSYSRTFVQAFLACFFAALKRRSIMTASPRRALFCSVSEHPWFSSIIMFFWAAILVDSNCEVSRVSTHLDRLLFVAVMRPAFSYLQRVILYSKNNAVLLIDSNAPESW